MRTSSAPTTTGLERIEALTASSCEPGWALLGVLALQNPPLGMHAIRGAAVASLLAQSTGVPVGEEELWGFLLRDLGMLELPARLLGTDSPLTPEGRQSLHRHPDRSARLLRHAPSLEGAVAVAACHHEAWNGHGYPQGLAGEAIPHGARALAIGDAFAAMTADRPYRPAHPPQEAAAEIASEGGRQFDPHLATTFSALVGTLPAALAHPPSPEQTLELFGPRFREHASRAVDLCGAQLEAQFASALGIGAAEAALLTRRSAGTQRTWMSSVRRTLACPSRLPTQRFLAGIGQAVYGTAIETWRDRTFIPLGTLGT